MNIEKMKGKNDQIIDLFRSRLKNAELDVRDEFWEELQDSLPAAARYRRRLIFFRLGAAACVLLVLAASSAAFLYFTPKQDMQETYSKVIVSGSSCSTYNDALRVNPQKLPLVSLSSGRTSCNISKPVTVSADNDKQINDDMVSVSVSITIRSSSRRRRTEQSNNQLSNYGDVNQENNAETTESVKNGAVAENSDTNKLKNPTLALKFFAMTALAAGNGKYKMPISAGVTLEKKLNRILVLESGLLFSDLCSEGQHLKYIGVPVKLNVILVQKGKIDLYASVGGIVDKCISGAPDNDFKHEPIQLALTAGIGLNYRMSDRCAVFVEPGMSHYFDTSSQLATVRTERPTNFNLLCGLRLTY